MANYEARAAVREFDLRTASRCAISIVPAQEAAGEGVSQIRVHNPDGAHTIAVRPRPPISSRNSRPRGLLRRRHEQASLGDRARQCGPGRGREHDVGPRPREGLRIEGRGRLGARRPARHRRRRVVALRNLAERRATSSSAAASAVCRPSWRRRGASSSAATRATRSGDSLYEAVIYVRGNVRSLGADAREEPMSGRGSRRRRRACCARPGRFPTTRTNSSGSLPPIAVSLAHGRQPGVLTQDLAWTSSRAYHMREESAASTARSSTTFSTRRRAASTKSVAWAPNAACRHFDDLVFLAASLSRYPLEGYRENVRDQDRARHALRETADRARRFRSPSPA